MNNHFIKYIKLCPPDPASHMYVYEVGFNVNALPLNIAISSWAMEDAAAPNYVKKQIEYHLTSYFQNMIKHDLDIMDVQVPAGQPSFYGSHFLNEINGPFDWKAWQGQQYPSDLVTDPMVFKPIKEDETPKEAPTLTALRNAIPNISKSVKCPIDGCDTDWEFPVSDVIMHLNDAHRKSREFIADWLETLDIDLSFRSPDED